MLYITLAICLPCDLLHNVSHMGFLVFVVHIDGEKQDLFAVNDQTFLVWNLFPALLFANEARTKVLRVVPQDLQYRLRVWAAGSW